MQKSESHLEQKKPQTSSETKNQASLLNRFLNSVLIEKYDVTINFFGKLIWPLISISVALIFYSDISKLADRLSNNLNKASRLKIAGVEIEIYADSLRGSDLDAYDVISQLNRDELLFILRRGETPLTIDYSVFTVEEINFLKALEEKKIVVPFSIPSESDVSDSSITIQLTDFGVRIYRELQSIIINFVEGLPAEENL